MYNTTPISAVKVLRDNQKDMIYTTGVDGNISIIDIKLTIPESDIGKNDTMVDFFFSDLNTGLSTEKANTFLTNVKVGKGDKAHKPGKIILGPNQSLNVKLRGTSPTSINITGNEHQNDNVINAGFLGSVLASKNRIVKAYGLNKTGVTHSQGTLCLVTHKPKTNITVWISKSVVNDSTTTKFQKDKVQYLMLDETGTVLLEGIVLLPGENIYVLGTEEVSASYMGANLNDAI